MVEGSFVCYPKKSIALRNLFSIRKLSTNMPDYLFSQQPVLLGTGGNGVSIGARDSTDWGDIASG